MYVITHVLALPAAAFIMFVRCDGLELHEQRLL